MENGNNSQPAINASPNVQDIPMSVYQKAALERRAFLELAATPRGYVFSLVSVAFCVLFCETVLFSGLGSAAGLLFILFQAFVLSFYKGAVNYAKTVWLSVPVIIISAGFMLHRNDNAAMVTLLTLIALTFTQIVVASSCEEVEIFTGKTVWNIISKTVLKPLSCLSLLFKGFKGAKGGSSTKGAKTAVSVVGGALVAIPFLAVLISLFSSADAVFEQRIDDFFERWDISPIRLFGDVSFGFVLAIGLGAVLLYNMISPASVKGTGRTLRVSPVGGTVFSVMVDAVLALFAALQLKYLFGGATNSIIMEIGYSEYARRGFFELVWASALVFAAVAAILALCRDEKGDAPLLVRLSALVMCLCDGVVLASAFKRMGLYINAHGLTIKRILPLWLMAVIALALLFIAAKCVCMKFKAFKAIGISTIALVCALSLANTQKIISEYDAEKMMEGSIPYDIEYFKQLGYPALPALVKLYDSGITTGLTCEYARRAIDRSLDRYDDRRLTELTFDDIRVEQSVERAREISEGIE